MQRRAAIPPSHRGTPRIVGPAGIPGAPGGTGASEEDGAPQASSIPIAPGCRRTPGAQGAAEGRGAAASHDALLGAGAEDRPREGQDDGRGVDDGFGVLAGGHAQLAAGVGQGLGAGPLPARGQAQVPAVRHGSAKPGRGFKVGCEPKTQRGNQNIHHLQTGAQLAAKSCKITTLKFKVRLLKPRREFKPALCSMQSVLKPWRALNLSLSPQIHHFQSPRRSVCSSKELNSKALH